MFPDTNTNNLKENQHSLERLYEARNKDNGQVFVHQSLKQNFTVHNWTSINRCILHKVILLTNLITQSHKELAKQIYYKKIKISST